jgi:hypothetical protein
MAAGSCAVAWLILSRSGEISMVLWFCVFALPIAVLTSMLILVWLKNRSELKRITAWAAILSGFISPIIGLWGLAHIDRLSSRKAFDYGFEENAWLISILAAILAFTWFIRSRQRYSFVVFMTACLSFVVWLMIVAKF